MLFRSPADLVIMGYNKVTYSETIDIIVAEGAYITMSNYEMSADQANYGETIDMSINIKNVGVDAVANLTATLSTSSEYVEIISGESTVAGMNPDEIVTLEGFQFSVAEDVPDNTNASFTLTMTDGTDTWESTFNIKLHAPVIEFESIEKTDGNVTISFKNSGSAPFYGGVLNITSCSPDLVFDPTTITFEDVVESDQTISFSFDYTINENVEPGTTFEASYHLSSGLFNLEDIFVISHGAIMEDFESGVFGDNWTFSQQYPWIIIEDGSKGTKCAKSANAGAANSESYMQLTVDVLAAGDLTFMYKVSSEMSSGGMMYDKLTFYMDGVQKGQWAGTSMTEFAQFVQPVTTGQHVFKWSYTKDSSVNSGDDCAWVDDIIFPPTSIITFLAPVTDLAANVDDTHVTLSWTESSEADSYIVMRDNEEIARVDETTFAEYVDYGDYVYSVIATTADGSLSIPTTISVSVVDYTDVAESNASFEVYPNPASNTLYIKGINATYRFALYNNMGQQVINGQAEGLKQIDVNNLAKGVYFLRITNGAQVSVQKVVVE